MSDREDIMRRWDTWRSYIKSGGGGSWPRDEFELLLDAMDEVEAQRDRLRDELHEAQWLTDQLRESVGEAQNDLRDEVTKKLWVSASTMKEDAPKWGEPFLIFLGGERLGELAIRAGQIGLARYVPDDRTGWRLETNWQFGLSEPTHWAKIPTPPKAEEA